MQPIHYQIFSWNPTKQPISAWEYSWLCEAVRTKQLLRILIAMEDVIRT
jgi:hypothetical protein